MIRIYQRINITTIRVHVVWIVQKYDRICVGLYKKYAIFEGLDMYMSTYLRSLSNINYE